MFLGEVQMGSRREQVGLSWSLSPVPLPSDKMKGGREAGKQGKRKEAGEGGRKKAKTGPKTLLTFKEQNKTTSKSRQSFHCKGRERSFILEPITEWLWPRNAYLDHPKFHLPFW